MTETAGMVHLSQPAVSRALGRLRDQLGDPLLVREGRAMVLTPYAEQLRPRLRKALLELERTLAQKQDFDPAAARGTLTLATTDFAAVVFMPAAVGRLSHEAPGLELVLAPYTEPFETSLESGECDFAVGPQPSTKSWIASEPLFSSDWVCVARRGHPWLDDPSLDGFCEALHLLVSPEGQGKGLVDGALRQVERTRKVVARVREFAGAVALAAQSELLLVVPGALARRAITVLPLGLAALPLQLPPSDVFISWHDARSHDPRHIWARGLAADVVRRSIAD